MAKVLAILFFSSPPSFLLTNYCLDEEKVDVHNPKSFGDVRQQPYSSVSFVCAVLYHAHLLFRNHSFVILALLGKKRNELTEIAIRLRQWIIFCLTSFFFLQKCLLSLSIVLFVRLRFSNASLCSIRTTTTERPFRMLVARAETSTGLFDGSSFRSIMENTRLPFVKTLFFKINFKR